MGSKVGIQNNHSVDIDIIYGIIIALSLIWHPFNEMYWKRFVFAWKNKEMTSLSIKKIKSGTEFRLFVPLTLFYFFFSNLSFYLKIHFIDFVYRLEGHILLLYLYETTGFGTIWQNLSFFELFRIVSTLYGIVSIFRVDTLFLVDLEPFESSWLYLLSCAKPCVTFF